MKTLIMINGTQGSPLQHFSLVGLTFAHSDVTYMEPYTVTGPGDWSIFRGGAVFIEGAESVSLESCHFRKLNGNAVFFSGFVRNSSVVGSYFESIGDSCIAAIGNDPFHINQTSGNFPQHNIISGNVFHSFGIFGKQTSAYFQSLAAHTTIDHNIIFNGPRAGVCFGTGFAGGNVRILLTNASKRPF